MLSSYADKIKIILAGLTGSGSIVYCQFNYFKSKFSHIYDMLSVYFVFIIRYWCNFIHL